MSVNIDEALAFLDEEFDIDSLLEDDLDEAKLEAELEAALFLDDPELAAEMEAEKAATSLKNK